MTPFSSGKDSSQYVQSLIWLARLVLAFHPVQGAMRMTIITLRNMFAGSGCSVQLYQVTDLNTLQMLIVHPMLIQAPTSASCLSCCCFCTDLPGQADMPRFV